MTQMKSRKQSIACEGLKQAMRDAFDRADVTEEDLADAAMVTQPTINRWFSYQLEHFPPLNALALLPENIVVPVVQHILSRFNKRVTDMEFEMHTDGRVEDQLLNIDRIQGHIIDLMNQNPRRAEQYCDDLIREAEIAKRELQAKQAGGKR